MKKLPAMCVGWWVVCAGLLISGKETLFEGDGKPVKLSEVGAGEGPAWHPEYGLFCSGEGHIMRFPLGAEDAPEVFFRDAGSNGLFFTSTGQLLICEPVKRRFSQLNVESRRLTVLAEGFGGKRFNQPNDIAADSKGRFYFSDPKYGPRTDLELVDAQHRPVEGVYCVDRSGSVRRIIKHAVDRPNGLAVSADDKFLYVADNNNNSSGGARKLWRFHLQAKGNINVASRVLLFDWEDGRGPDGMALDREGRIYIAAGRNQATQHESAEKWKAGIYVLSPAGELLDFVHVPRDEVTNCTFGGADLRTLYITAGGSLWSIRTKATGSLVWPRVD